VEVAINTGCVLFKEGDYEGAAAKFNEAAAMEGSQVGQPEDTLPSLLCAQTTPCDVHTCTLQPPSSLHTCSLELLLHNNH
jgi:hypothetical protein